ncbi:MAG: TonB-dependent receptor [Pseudomonadales bacterium]|nr:TonB-dependent receptor [Pseudomonadales bacterium]
MNRIKRLIYLPLNIGWLFSCSAFGQSELLSLQAANIEEVIITASQSRRSLVELPYSAHLLDETFLARQQPRNMPEALNNLPGVLVQKTANGQGSPILRGFTGYRTLTLIDGVRYNNAVYRDGANEYFSLIDSQTLAGIELLSGPGSTLYGGDAIGGTLNLITKAAPIDQHVNDAVNLSGQQSYRYSSAEQSRISRTELAVGSQTLALLVGYSRKEFSNIKSAGLGEQPKTGYAEDAFDLRIDYLVNDNWAMTLLHQTLQQDEVWRTHSTIFAKSFAATSVGTDLRRVKDQRRSLTYLKLKGEDFESIFSAIELTLSSQSWDENGNRIKSNAEGIVDYFDSRMNGFDLQLYQTFDNYSLVYGVDYYQDQVDSGRVDQNVDGSVKQVRVQGPIGDDAQFDIYGAYIQLDYTVTEQLNLTFGSRYTKIRIDIGQFEDPATAAARSISDAWSSMVSTVRFSYAFDVYPGLHFWGGISQSFRAPNVADMSRFGKSRSNETEIAATDLDPEYFLTYELGLKRRGAKTEFSSSYFYTAIGDYITSTPTGNIRDGLIEVSKTNSSKGAVEGLELQISYFLADGYTLSGNLTWLEANLEGEPMTRIMPFTTNVKLAWASNEDAGWWWEIGLQHANKATRLSAGDKSDTQRIPPGGTPAYTLFDMRAGRQFGDHIQLIVSLDNMTNEAYRRHGSGTNEPGRGLSVGFSASF